MGSRAVRLAVFTAAVALLGFGHAELGRAAMGDVRRDLPAGSPGGVSVAFDGKNLYYTDRNGVVLHSMTPGGAARPDVPIVGAPGINAITYDVTHDFFWAVDSTGLAVYQLTRDGFAWPQFVLIPAVDLPGLCDVPTACSAVVSGLAYDTVTDSLWYVPQLSQRIYHFTTAGQLIGYFDTNETSGSFFPECSTNGVSGLAAGGDSLYLAAGACTSAFRYTKSDSHTATKLASFRMAPGSADIECDDVTFGVTVIWVRSVSDGHLRAVEPSPGVCAFGGGVKLVHTGAWMTGAGRALSQFELPVQHAFHLLCDPSARPAEPNNLVANWEDADGNHFSFHLNAVDPTTVYCFFDPTKPPDPPDCDPEQADLCINTITGSGTGRLTGRTVTGQIIAGAPGPNNDGDVTFRFTDHGEPNRKESFATQPATKYDWGTLDIVDVQGRGVVSCGCEKANYQAHQG